MTELSALSNGLVADSAVTRRHGDEAKWVWIWRVEEVERSFNIAAEAAGDLGRNEWKNREIEGLKRLGFEAPLKGRVGDGERRRGGFVQLRVKGKALHKPFLRFFGSGFNWTVLSLCLDICTLVSY